MTRVVSAQALVSFRGNRYSVPPQLHACIVTATVRLGSDHLDIATTPSLTSPRVLATVIARHALAPTGAGATIRDHHHVTAQNAVALGASTREAPYRGKALLPPSPAARTRADELRAATAGQSASPGDAGSVIDLARYAAAATAEIA